MLRLSGVGRNPNSFSSSVSARYQTPPAAVWVSFRTILPALGGGWGTAGCAGHGGPDEELEDDDGEGGGGAAGWRDEAGFMGGPPAKRTIGRRAPVM